MAMQTLSLATIINESQQGEQAARRAAPAIPGIGGVGLPEYFGTEPDKKPVKKDSGAQSVQGIQEELEKSAEEKKKALEEANKATISTAESLQTINQIDYTQTFLKILGLV